MRQTERFSEAEELYKEAMAFARKYSHEDSIAYIQTEIGKLAGDRKDWETARYYLEAAVAWYKKHQVNKDLSLSFMMAANANLGWVEFHLGQYHLGEKLIESSLAFFERNGRRGMSTKQHWRLANIAVTIGEHRKALQYLQEVCFWAERLGMKREFQAAQDLLTQLNSMNPVVEKMGAFSENAK